MLNTTTHAFPIHATPFIGRSEELTDMLGRLQDPTCRLLTVIGPGGMGKTRLVQEVGRAIVEHTLPANAKFGVDTMFSDGVYFVPLQPLMHAELIVHTISQTINLPLYEGLPPRQQLMDYVADKDLLLILDNFEHLMEVGADLVGDLLAHAPNLKLLITSREALNLQEEWLYAMRGMPYPAPSEHVNGNLMDYGAVRLFVQHATRLRPDFDEQVERDGIIHICQLVEGTPLALEMAASWVRALSSAEIAAEIERGLDILQTPARNVPQRHRSMRAVIESSWALLDENDQCVMMWLAVFQGGFTRQAAEKVTGAVVGELSSLLDKSWLRRGSDGRYEVHELLRQYAAEKLAESGEDEAEAAANAHIAYYAQFMYERQNDIKGGRQLAALREVETEFANVRAAWKRAIAAGKVTMVDQMLESLHMFCDMRGRYIEALRLLQPVIDQWEATSLPQNRTPESRQAELLYRRARVRQIRMRAQAAKVESVGALEVELAEHVAALRELDAPIELAYAVRVLGEYLSFHNWQADATEQAFTEGLALARENGDPFYLAAAVAWFGLMSKNHDFELTRAYLYESLELARTHGNLNEMRWTLSNLVMPESEARNHVGAEAVFHEAMSLHTQFEDRVAPIWCLVAAAQHSCVNGDFGVAIERATSSLNIAEHLSHPKYKYLPETIRAFAHAMLEEFEAAEQWMIRASATHIYLTHFYADVWYITQLTLACQRGDRAGALAHFKELLEAQDYSQRLPLHRLWLAAPAAVLILAQSGEMTRAVEYLARVITHPDLPPVGWLEKAPYFIHLRESMERELGTAAYAAAWERGTRLHVEVILAALAEFNPDASPNLTPDPSPNLERGEDDGLTARELDVLRLIAEGLSNREIAERLVLSVGTVKWYVNQMYSKLQVESRTQAVAKARGLGLLE